MKTCSKCSTHKPLAEFYKRSDTGKPHSWCKTCKHQSGKQWSAKNKARHSEINAAWYVDNKDKHLENSKIWYQANKSRKLETTTAREKRCVLATPVWADRELIKELYALAQKLTEQTGIPHEVDHIIPLQGKEVCGFHLEDNLQVITQAENRRKSNKMLCSDERSGHLN